MKRRLLACCVALALAPSALAQQGPAGNTHPEPPALAPQAAPSPFGEPVVPSPFTPERKYAFSTLVDLSPLRDAAVFHGARVKILDTLARETVESITGRKRYIDYLHSADGAVEDVWYDPLFTFLDLMIDPAYYADKPLIHVRYLPLRRELLEMTDLGEETRERWMRVTRLSPLMIAQGHDRIGASGAIDAATMEGLEDAAGALRLFHLGYMNLAVVPPMEGALSWGRLDESPADSALRAAVGEMSDAWRAADAARVNAAAARVAELLSQASPGRARARALEAAYNRVRPFEWGAWLYCVALIGLLLAFGTGRGWLIGVGVGALGAAVATHAFGFGARWAIAERLPIQNQFESMTGLALGGALVGFVIMVVKRQWLFGAAAALAGFLTLLAATQTAIPGESIGREAAILNTSVLLKYHVSTVLVSYGLITLGFGVSLFYLAVHYLGRRAPVHAATSEGAGDVGAVAASGLGLDTRAGVRRVLADLDTAQMTVLQLAFWTLGVGILLGAWWADHSWGRWWAFDPKETWALITWIVYLIAIHVRFTTTRDRGLVTAWLSVIGFVVMLWTYFGVNLLLPGLHAYA